MLNLSKTILKFNLFNPNIHGTSSVHAVYECRVSKIMFWELLIVREINFRMCEGTKLYVAGKVY